jgi:hypothetical protein
MTQREIQLVRDFCHEIDILVSSDPRAPDLDVSEKARLKMNGYLWRGKYAEAEALGLAIQLKYSGVEAGQYLLKEMGD